MSWIKDNQFLASLGGGTLVVAAALIWFGLKGSSRYEAAMESFVDASSEASRFEKLPLYPRPENVDGKRKALDEYRESVEALQTAFEGFRPKELENISPQDFATRLKAVDEELRSAFEAADAKVPDPFFCGFESYKTSLARGDSTGILNYQLEGIRKLMLILAKSGATELKNVYRPQLVEEKGEKFTPAPEEVARQLPVEITFSGPESSVREFLSSVVEPSSEFFVIRSLRIMNEKKEPPMAADARFDKPADASNPPASEAFGGGFVLPGEETVPSTETESAPAAAEVDTSRILSQVLGNEEIRVVVRLDQMQFLPAKKLP